MENKNCINLGCITWCFHICVHCKMITKIRLINISITLYGHHFFFLVVLYGLLDFNSTTRGWIQALGTENAGILTTGLSRNSPLTFFFWFVCSEQLRSTLFANFKHVVVVQSLSCVRLFVTPCTAACQASLSFTISWSLLSLMSIESVMSSHHLILCHPLLLMLSILLFTPGG